MAFDISEPDETGSINIRSEHFGGTGMRLPKPGSAPAAMVPNLMSIAHALDNAAGMASRNSGLSDAGRREAIEKPRAELISRLNTEENELAVQSAHRRQQRAALSEPGPSENPESDREVRQLYAGLDERKRGELDAQMLAGERDSILRALLRAPIAETIPPAVKAVWESRVQATSGLKLRELDDAADAADRARTVIVGLRNLVERAKPFGE